MEKQIEDEKRGRSPSEILELNLDNCPGPVKFVHLQPFINLESLSLNNSNITTLKGFPKLPNLKKLELSSNKISNSLYFLNGCHKLTHLNLSNNEIKDIGMLKPLARLKNLQSLILVNCDVTKLEDYRKKVFSLLSSLSDLDGEDKRVVDEASPPRRTRSSAKQDEENMGSSVNLATDEKEASSEIKQKSTSENPVKLETEDSPGETNLVKDNEVPKDNSVANNSGSKGKKRKLKGNDSFQRKKRKVLNLQQKNALMQLNELKPGLKYIVESQSGPPHNPEFVVSVEVNEQKYIGRGTSKQLAKHAAAQAALSSFVQFRNMPEAMTAMSRPISMGDFTTDNVENEGFNFNKFEIRKNGAENEVIISTGNPALKKPLKILTEADKKNPVMLLNEIHPGLTFQLAEENSAVPSQRFRMTVEVTGHVYEGTGQNKKQAKASAARAVLSNLYNVSYSIYPTALLPEAPDDAELFHFPQAVADKIFKMLMSTFNEVMTGNPDNAKWKVIAGIAMTKDEAMQDIQIISFGTGTKCVNGEHISLIGANLNDCHAEIISRRCFKDFLYTNLELHLEGEGDQSIFLKREEGGGFCLRPHIKFHLFISTAPCGDARIFCPHEEGTADPVDRHPNRNSRGVLRTKIESGEGTIPVKPGMCIQTWDGILPGQERLLTMSCSDKIASWNVLGLQGALLSHFMEPIYLDSVILGGLFHPNHLRRALFGRIEGTIKDLPPPFQLNKPKMCAITSPETRHLVKSPNFSVNWTVGLGRAEVINANTGKTDSGQISRLAKRSFFQRFMNIYDRLPHVVQYNAPSLAVYGGFKSVVKNYQESKKALTSAFVAAGLGHWVKKPIEQNDFEHV